MIWDQGEGIADESKVAHGGAEFGRADAGGGGPRVVRVRNQLLLGHPLRKHVWPVSSRLQKEATPAAPISLSNMNFLRPEDNSNWASIGRSCL
jgi:hypothetical protein